MLKIKKIAKINNLGIFNNFTWPSGLPEFKQYNIIYGWNGTGKTTLSKLLGTLNSSSYSDYPKLEYSLLCSDNTTHSHDVNFPTPIRVFNRDFIDDNVNFETQSSKIITVILGEENKDTLAAIDKDQKLLNGIETEIQLKSTNKKNLINTRNTLFTDIARTISQGTQGAIVRNYNRTNAEDEFKLLNSKSLLKEDEIKTLSKSVSQSVMAKQQLLNIEKKSTELEKTLSEIEVLLAQTVEAVVIQRLKENSDISEWVEHGLKIHNKYKNNKCEFCGNSLTESRLGELTTHFNEADAKLKENIDVQIELIRSIYSFVQGIQPIDKMNFYQEFRDEYSLLSQQIFTERDKLLKIITVFAEVVKSKKLHTTEVMQMPESPSLMKLKSFVDSINKIVLLHNKKTDDFDIKRKEDSKRIELHYLSTIYDQTKNIDKEIEELSKTLDSLNNGVEGDEDKIGKSKLKLRILENKAKVSSSHKACTILNDSLKKFLGHGEITFDVNEDATGYQINRGSELAKSLSEGERTAIAFVYFVTQLQDENFNAESGIVVVDDPISSLDANSQFQAFSFLKNATKSAGQLFLLTHNFDFLKLVLGWIKKSHKEFSLYMIKNSYSVTDGSRVAYIDKLDTALEKFESEYHYLFNVLKNYKDDGTIENAYRIPNIARKLLDNFLMFCVPKNVSTYERLQELSFDEEKKTAIYKFVNDQSHITGSGFDPALVPETQKCVRYLLELIETVFPSHFSCLNSS